MAQINLTKTTTPTTPSPNRAGMFINNSNDLIIIDENGSLIPTGESITGGTFSNTVLNLVKSDGSTVVVTGFTDNDIFVTGGTFSNNVLNLENNDGSTVVVTGFTDNDIFVTGGTFSNNVLNLENNDGSTVVVTGFTDFYTTGTTLNNTTLEFNTVNQQNAYNTDLSSLVGVTGGTYNSNTDEIEFTGTQPNSSFSFSVSGLSQDIFVTGGTYNNNNGVVTFNNNNGNSFSVSGFITGFTDFYTTGATLNNTTLEFNRTDQSNAYDVDLSSLNWTGGTNYILVKAEGTDTENATELQEAYNLAVSASTVMSASSDNRITIIAAPGNYNFDSNFVMDEEFIDLVSLDGNRSVVFNGTQTISITANDVFVRGVDVLTKSFLGGDSSSHRIENCKGGDYSFGGNGLTTALGTFVNCEGGDNSFGSNFVLNDGSASGTFVDCVGGDYSFGGSGTLSGTFTNCIGGDYSFGGTNNPNFVSGGTLSGTFTNCVGGDSSFGGINSFLVSGGTLSGTFTNCVGGVRSFGSSPLGGGTLSGTFKNCEGGFRSFGSGAGGVASGIFTNCIGGDDSFGGNGGSLSGRVIRCQLTTGTFETPVLTGKIILGIDGNDNIINLTA